MYSNGITFDIHGAGIDVSTLVGPHGIPVTIIVGPDGIPVAGVVGPDVIYDIFGTGLALGQNVDIPKLDQVATGMRQQQQLNMVLHLVSFAFAFCLFVAIVIFGSLSVMKDYGCNTSILLDDTTTLTGEKNAGPNQNSVCGFEVIDTNKTNVEAACNAIVSCADILALEARDGVVLLGGPTRTVPLGRRDARTASQSAANSQLPSPTSTLASLTSNFAAQGLNIRDLTVLSGAHTIGQARCTSFRKQIYNDTNIDYSFATL